MKMTVYWLCGVAVMALVTYLPRVLPLSLMRRKVNNRFVRSLLYYMPYAVLGAMTFPAILYSTATMWSALAGMAAALVLSFMGKGLLPVALVSTAAVFITECLMRWGHIL